MPTDPEIRIHKEWLAYLQPTGVVVAPPALVAAQAYPDSNIASVQRRFAEWAKEIELDGGQTTHIVADLPGMLMEICGWIPERVCGLGSDPIPSDLEVSLPEYEDVLRPTLAVRDPDPEEESSPWQMLVEILDRDELDEVPSSSERGWLASPQRRFERLLRETGVPIGLLTNGSFIRLVYAPRGETSGYLTFPVSEMRKVSGRQVLAAFHMLLSSERLFALPRIQRLPAIMAESRKYQSEVSNALAGQVLGALYELLRGFQAADHQRQGRLLADVLAKEPDHVYAGLLSVLMRCVFVLFAEDRGLLSNDPVYVRYYSLSGLFERLREDSGRFPDTMDQRYGSWAQLCTLFRMVREGASHGDLKLPARHGYLFDPDRYPFLEGRVASDESSQILEPPMVSDGVVYRVLQKLMILDGERLSYRNLDVEQIGSVYERMIGFLLEVAEGPSIAIRPAKRHGAPVTIDLRTFLETSPKDRSKQFLELTDLKLTPNESKAVADAGTLEELLEALSRKIDRRATPNVVAQGAMVLQPSEERRRSGSYYTPRSLTGPIVAKALRPILERLGDHPTPDQILELKVCDPAMGSGAFLVQACRQLGDELVKAWRHRDVAPKIPPDEDEELHAKRLVARRCLYGVDRNPMATDLAKLSLWLETLARDHAFTFLDHALRNGDSLVGLDRDRLGAFHWERTQQDLPGVLIDERMKKATSLRQEIRESPEDVGEEALASLLLEADEVIEDLRLVGDLAILAFFEGSKKKEREALRAELGDAVLNWLKDGVGKEELAARSRGLGERRLVPFHWATEFPEVFDRENPGFDAIVGNPPFAGKNTLIASNPDKYPDWLKQIHAESHGNSDLVAHFFLRAFTLVRRDGCFGLLATNTIAQGDTRHTGLRWICTNGGKIYAARKRYKWPGEAAVVVSVVHVFKGDVPGPFELDGKPGDQITAYLFHTGGHENPALLEANKGRSFQGAIVLGMGFTFDDSNEKATPIAEMHRLIEKDARNAERIFPYIGGEEVNDSPTHSHHRFVINFGEMAESEARKWPDLMAIVEDKVKPERLEQKDKGAKERWWQFIRPRSELRAAIEGLGKILVCARHQPNWALTFVPAEVVLSEALVVVASDRFTSFAVLQSRGHELWARFFGSSMKDDLRYTPSDCFEAFPFPHDYEESNHLELVGKAYFEFRAALMNENNEGLTKTYNRFHDPEESSSGILKLRELHDAMDEAVLEAYGWADLKPTCDFFLAYEEEEAAEEDSKSSHKRPWRYRWDEDTHDEVLARLLALNRARAEEERLVGATRKSTGKRGKKGFELESTTSLFEEDEDG